MRRPTRTELDQSIIDWAALLFARHGYSHTSVQQIADVVGYSKTGLLHRFPKKEALRRAAVEQIVTELGTIRSTVGTIPVGAVRDLAVISGLADLALTHRGLTALLISAVTEEDVTDDAPGWMRDIADGIFEVFGESPEPIGLTRRIRICGALGALSVTSVVMTAVVGSKVSEEYARDILVDTAFEALGHSDHPAQPVMRRRRGAAPAGSP